jgi:hypothetical protein
MYKVLNMLFIILIVIFSWNIFQYYSSNENFKTKDFNRNNIDQIINKKISNIPVLSNDTNNVIEFNNSLSNETNTSKPRSFWNLLKSE